MEEMLEVKCSRVRSDHPIQGGHHHGHRDVHPPCHHVVVVIVVVERLRAFDISFERSSVKRERESFVAFEISTLIFRVELH